MFKYIKFLSQYFQKERKNIALIFVFVMLSQSFSLLEPVFYTRILDRFLRDSHNLTKFPTEHAFFVALGITVLAWIASAFAARIFKNFQQYYVNTVSDRIGINVFNHAYEHVISLPIQFHANQKTGEVFRKISKAREDITTLFGVAFDKIFQNVFSISIVLIYIFIREWRVGVIAIILVPVFIIATSFFTKRVKKIQGDINKSNERLFGTSFEALNHIEVVKSFASEEHEINQVREDNKVTHDNVKKKTIAYQQLFFVQGTIVNLARVSLIWFGSVLAFKGVLTFADVILFGVYSFVIYQPLYDLGDIYAKYQEGVSAVDRLQTLLSEKATIFSKPNALKPKKLQGKIEFKNVSFNYSQEREILKNVSFKVEPGKKLAIVGFSGSGKSTIVKLLLRFYEPTTGEILIDGKNIADYNLQALHKRIGLVLQDNILFNTTLSENIRYGTFKASDTEVEASANRAYLSDFLKKLSLGLDTLVGERGVKLSGGERQRVAIARSIIKKPDILIFDEATSSLDSHSEEMIKEAISQVSKDVTTITVAHRFSTVVNADEIILLEAGEISERGNHKELLAKKGRYASLYQLQTQRQAEEPYSPSTIDNIA
ncbi:MAG: multidrug ABC transporter ATPase/permease [Candidatus Doudnabacteria bacterium Gr01-1014_77]|uniref:Multidrug ABC transporter ATPase/permease n=1 Tax=Candidatus Doudnabacteria bacterium Gr01-1014_77 TaxID=2017133 RepID=A0A554JCC3_9BACT|nr:MAG: multidrug ABC transporter ATPase/permease [Candidatus Doudnabacteria bacterium Gr01-1014_77]